MVSYQDPESKKDFPSKSEMLTFQLEREKERREKLEAKAETPTTKPQLTSKEIEDKRKAIALLRLDIEEKQLQKDQQQAGGGSQQTGIGEAFEIMTKLDGMINSRISLLGINTGGEIDDPEVLIIREVAGVIKEIVPDLRLWMRSKAGIQGKLPATQTDEDAWDWSGSGIPTKNQEAKMKLSDYRGTTTYKELEKQIQGGATKEGLWAAINPVIKEKITKEDYDLEFDKIKGLIQ